MKGTVIVVLGGGSVWTPYLLQELAPLAMPGLEVRLQGPTEEHLQEVAAFSLHQLGDALDVAAYPRLEEALLGARIVIHQTRVGGWAARLADETLPVSLGAVGDESQGLGGLRAAIRCHPFVVQTARQLARLAPEAWLLNLSNPSDLVSRAWRQAGCRRVISLCDHPQGLMEEMATAARAPQTEERFGFLGLNHLGWLIPPRDFPLRRWVAEDPELAAWTESWGAVPTPWRRHLANPQPLLSRQSDTPGERALCLTGLVRQLRRAIRLHDGPGYTDLVQRRSPVWYSKMVVPAVRALLGLATARLIVGLPNRGRLPGLEDDVQLESWATLDAAGVHPESLPPNARCREDIARLGATRALAFAALLDPSPPTLRPYLSSEAFVPTASEAAAVDSLAQAALEA